MHNKGKTFLRTLKFKNVSATIVSLFVGDLELAELLKMPILQGDNLLNFIQLEVRAIG